MCLIYITSTGDSRNPRFDVLLQTPHRCRLTSVRILHLLETPLPVALILLPFR